MLDLPSPSQIDHDVSGFLQHSSARSLGQPPKSLQAEDASGSDKVSTLVGASAEPLKAGFVAYYIQAIVTRQSSTPSICKSAFLTTNLTNLEEPKVTEVATTWLIGRSKTCAIVILNPSISRCHAVIGYDPSQGFYITDVGSSNGTFINQQRVPILERRLLIDGDLISFSHISIEFFVSHLSTVS